MAPRQYVSIIAEACAFSVLRASCFFYFYVTKLTQNRHQTVVSAGYALIKQGGDMLKIDKLTKRFGDKTAVDAANILVEKPSMIGIIGRSGAGKSTLLRMVNCLSDASEGTITFEGEEITGMRGAARRNWQSRCAMIFQQFNLVPRMDVVSNVLHGTLNKRST
ncbi:MAG: ABC-type proline/glycine betaine transport system ATPase subunit, partial [Yoonia sp.]